MSGSYIRQDPYVDDEGIYVPLKEYIPKGSPELYRCIITKEMFVEAYNKWIKKGEPKRIYPIYSDDDADCWSE